MKGTNTIILNEEQMKDIVNKWWDRITYETKDECIDITIDDNGNFEIILDEFVEVKKDV